MPGEDSKVPSLSSRLNARKETAVGNLNAGAIGSPQKPGSLSRPKSGGKLPPLSPANPRSPKQSVAITAFKNASAGRLPSVVSKDNVSASLVQVALPPELLEPSSGSALPADSQPAAGDSAADGSPLSARSPKGRYPLQPVEVVNNPQDYAYLSL